MYDIRQFIPALYLVLFLGMSGFCLTVEAPGLWLLSISVLGLHGWLFKTGRFRPMPRVAANLITLVALIYTYRSLRPASVPGATPLITIGQFLVFLQMVKLFELRANKDYGQILVLSLLLMVAGAISKPSLAFGALLIVYLFVALYACLLFHLRIENENALRAQTPPRGKPNENTLRQDQRHLTRSMRRLAGLVAVVGLGSAVFVFLFFPRGPGANMFGQLQIQRPALTGFSEDVSLGDINRISQNDEIVAQVRAWKNDAPLEGAEPLLLRGRTFDRYNTHRRNWERTGNDNLLNMDRDSSGGGELRPAASRLRGDVYRLKIALRPTGTDTLFSLPGLLSFIPSRIIGNVHYSGDDETLSSAEMLNRRFDYTITARNVSPEPGIHQRPRVPHSHSLFPGVPVAPGVEYTIPPRIAEYARRPEVSGLDRQGRPLAEQRPPGAAVSPLDEQIARNIETHLRSTFGYTLDLTNEQNDRQIDPIVHFLYDWKKGHCEYFASAMVLMCQSMGMQARMVTGFRSDEYDGALGHYYVIRQSHAHAWVEVKTPEGWKTFDPTSGNDLDGAMRPTAWQSVKHFFDWLEFKWAEKVVAYDSERRENLVNGLNAGVVEAMVNARVNPRSFSHRAQRMWDSITDRIDDWLHGDSMKLSETLILLALLFLGVCFLGYRLWRRVHQRRIMRRRAVKIGLDNLPTAEQIRLARQLGFYEQLTTLLERSHISRPRHQTSAEFSDALSFLPNEAYHTIRRLTRVFYSIRYGRHEISVDEQVQLESTVQDLEPILQNKRTL